MICQVQGFQKTEVFFCELATLPVLDSGFAGRVHGLIERLWLSASYHTQPQPFVVSLRRAVVFVRPLFGAPG